MSFVRIHAGNDYYNRKKPPVYDDSTFGPSRKDPLEMRGGRGGRGCDIREVKKIMSQLDKPNSRGAGRLGAGACKSGICGGSSSDTPSKVKVEQILREGPGWKQWNLRFTDPKTGQSVKPDRDTFKFLLDRGYKPKQEKGSSSALRSFSWRKKGSEAEVSPTTLDFLKTKPNFVLADKK